MKKKRQIKTLQDLREEKEKVRGEIALSEKALRRCGTRIRSRLKDRLLRQILLPASLAGLAAFGIREITYNGNGEVHAQNGKAPEGKDQPGGPVADIVLKVLDNLL